MRPPTSHMMKTSFLVAAAACCMVQEAEASTSMSLLEGKLTFELPDGFVVDEKRATKQIIAGFKAKKGNAWGVIARGTRGMDPEALGEYLAKKTAEYTKGLAWLPKLTWLKKETIVINGRKWADLRFIGQMEKPKSPMEGMLYTRILATSYEGQLLEIVFTSNTDRDAATKARIDLILESVKLVD